MARTEARLHFDIWVGLERVSADARLLYVVLLTDRSVNHAGVGSIRFDQWMRHSGLPIERVEKAVVELGQEPHVVLDRHTGEFLIRTMIRRDNYESQPYLLKGALAVATNTESKTLRRVLARELRKLPPQKPDGVSKAGNPIVYPDPHACADTLEAGTGPDDDPGGGVTPEGPETLFSGSLEAVETHSTVSRQPVAATPSRKGVEREGGGGGGSGGGVTSRTTHLEESAAELSLVATDPPAKPTESQRIQALTKGYVERVPLSKFVAVRGIVAKAVRCQRYSDEAIAAALARLADNGRAVTVDALRIELEGKPRKSSRPTTDDRVAGALALLRDEPERGSA